VTLGILFQDVTSSIYRFTGTIATLQKKIFPAFQAAVLVVGYSELGAAKFSVIELAFEFLL